MVEPFSIGTAITAAFLIPLINEITGGRFGNLFSQKACISFGKPLIFTMAPYAVGRPIRQKAYIS